MSNIASTQEYLQAEIDSRLAEIEKLQAALTTLDGVKKVESTKKETDELKARRLENLKKAREAKAAKTGSSRHDQILKLLKTKSVNEVAEKLNVSKGYVYNVKNREAHKAA